MPLVERGDPQADEEGKEEREAGTQLLEAATPVPTEPQVRRLEDLGKEDLRGRSHPAVTLLPFSPRPPNSWICWISWVTLLGMRSSFRL